jgi:hypothetical protein
MRLGHLLALGLVAAGIVAALLLYNQLSHSCASLTVGAKGAEAYAVQCPQGQSVSDNCQIGKSIGQFSPNQVVPYLGTYNLGHGTEYLTTFGHQAVVVHVDDVTITC